LLTIFSTAAFKVTRLKLLLLLVQPAAGAFSLALEEAERWLKDYVAAASSTRNRSWRSVQRNEQCAGRPHRGGRDLEERRVTKEVAHGCQENPLKHAANAAAVAAAAMLLFMANTLVDLV